MKKEIRFNAISLANFQIVKELTVELDGGDIVCSAKNGVGKTTISTGVHWLFWDCNSVGESPKTLAIPLDTDNKPIHHLTTSVFIAFTVDGKAHDVKREMTETWSVKSGESKDQGRHTGYSSNYFLDGVKYSTQRDWQKELEKIVGSLDILRQIIDPVYFLSDRFGNASIKPEDRRRGILLEMAGSITDAEIIDAYPDIAPLKERRGDRTVDNYSKFCKGQRDEAIKERKEIPIQITTASSLRKDVPKGDHAWKAQTQESIIKKLQEERAQVFAGGSIAKLETEIAQIGTKLVERQNELLSGGNPERDKALTAQRDLKQRIQTAEMDIRNRSTKIAADEATLADVTGKRERLKATLRDQLTEINKIQESQFGGLGPCEVCGNPMSEDKVDAAREKWNTRKAARLSAAREAHEADKARCKRFRDQMEALGGQVIEGEHISGSIAIAQSELTLAIQELNGLKTELESLVIPADTTPKVEEDSIYQTLLENRDGLRAKVSKLRGDSQASLNEIDSKIESAKAVLDKAKEAIDAANRNADVDKKIADLNAREKVLASQIEDWDIGINLCDKFIRAQSDFLTARINRHFNVTNWKLFIHQMNEGTKPTCQALWHLTGAPPSTGESIAIGMDVVRALSAHYGVSCPCFIDGVESCGHKVDMGCQVIELRFEEGLFPMRIETPSARMERMERIGAVPFDPAKVFVNKPEPSAYLGSEAYAPDPEKPFAKVENPKPDVPRTKKRGEAVMITAQTGVTETTDNLFESLGDC